LGVNLVKTIWTIKNEIEGFKSLKFKILGLMMHPERQKNIDTYKNYVAEFLRQ
jgi:phosphoribosylformylglycinamidine (FGAM) synthase-like amidotransferase family enzyme